MYLSSSEDALCMSIYLKHGLPSNMSKMPKNSLLRSLLLFTTPCDHPMPQHLPSIGAQVLSNQVPAAFVVAVVAQPVFVHDSEGALRDHPSFAADVDSPKQHVLPKKTSCVYVAVVGQVA